MAPSKKRKTATKKTVTAVAGKKPSRLKAKAAAPRPSVKIKKVTKPAKPAKPLETTKKTKPVSKARLSESGKKAVVKKPVSGKAISKAPATRKKTVTRATKKIAAKGDPERDRLLELKRTLISKRETIVREAKEEIAKYISGENRQLVDTALDEGDWAVVDISEDVNLNRLASHRKTLHNIDEALRKINEGTYGICEECGEEISEKRLIVLPTATLCISCQENKEQFEAIERVETE